MNSLLLALVLSCPPGASGGACACSHGADAKSTTVASAAGETSAESKDEGVCHHPDTAASGPAKTDAAIITRGDKLKGEKAVELTRLLSAPADFDGKTVAVEAKVRRACTAKGCWMELAGTDKGPGVRVTFKDYGFFVPLDSAGSTAKVEGVVKVAELSDERAHHYESEGAQVAKGKDGKYREVQLVASGLELRR
jgi:hypothetical protein